MNRNYFGCDTTTDEVLEGIDLRGKLALVSGGSSGLGAESAQALASKGASVVITARNIPKGRTVAKNILEATGNSSIEVMYLDLGSIESINTFAKQFLSKYDSLNLLINNAGVMACPFAKTENGFEFQFGINHLGHFLLTKLLTPALLKGAPARIVNLSSRAHRISPVVFDDIQFQHRPYDKWSSYGQSKTANVLHTVELERRLSLYNVHAYAVHPGVIETELMRHLEDEDYRLLAPLKRKTVKAGAATSIYASTAPELEGKGGIYLLDCRIADISGDPNLVDVVRPYAIDSELARQLWLVSENLIESNRMN